MQIFALFVSNVRLCLHLKLICHRIMVISLINATYSYMQFTKRKPFIANFMDKTMNGGNNRAKLLLLRQITTNRPAYSLLITAKLFDKQGNYIPQTFVYAITRTNHRQRAARCVIIRSIFAPRGNTGHRTWHFAISHFCSTPRTQFGHRQKYY
jgi:hypothetical protein